MLTLEKNVALINKKQMNLDKFTNYLKTDFDINPIGIGLILELLKEQNVNSDNYLTVVNEILLSTTLPSC